jgi:preprotein translocase subunit SecY
MPCCMQNGPRISLYMVLFSIVASYFSTFWSYGYTRLSRKLMAFSEALEGTDVTSKGVKKKDVKQTLRNGLTVNVVGMGSALLGLQAMVGMLVGTTSSNALEGA